METITSTDFLIFVLIIIVLIVSIHLVRLNFKKLPTGIDTCSGTRYFDNQREIQACTYQLMYPDFKRFIVLSDNLHDLYDEFILKRWEKTTTVPIEIELPDGRIIPYLTTTFHLFFIEGTFGDTEEDLISALIAPVELKSVATA